MYLGLDLGTSSIKAILMDGRQKIVGSTSAPLTVDRPQIGWSEQDPESWIIAMKAALAMLSRTHAPEYEAVRAIGLSGHMHGATAIDQSGRVIRPSILWNDTRSHAEAADLDADPRFRATTGNIVFSGFTAPKLVWMQRHERKAFQRIAKVLLPKDYLRYWLTGETISDMSDASGTAWLDTGRRVWDDALIEATGMRREQMPDLVEGTERAGTLRSMAASELGLKRGIPVAGGAGDNAASACGIGAVGDGQAFLSLGTSGVLLAANSGYRPNAASAVHTFCHALPGMWHQMGVVLSATDALNWYAGVAGRDAAALAAEIAEELKAPGPALFLPYLGGERTPHNDARVRGAFAGLGHEADRPALTRAVLEGVAFAFRDSLEALAQAGTAPERVTGIGGGSRSVYWLKVLATVLDLPVELPADGDFGAAFGAARLGLIAAEDADPISVCTPPRTARTILPDAALKPAFDAAYHRYRDLYPALKGALG